MPYIENPTPDELAAIERQRVRIKATTQGIKKGHSKCLECGCVYPNDHPESYKWQNTRVWQHIICHFCSPTVSL